MEGTQDNKKKDLEKVAKKVEKMPETEQKRSILKDIEQKKKATITK